MIDLPGARLTEEQRRPLIDDDGRALLHTLLEHEAAPHFNHTCGDRLTADGLAAVRTLASATRAARPPDPAWLDAYAARCLRSVPVYRDHGVLPSHFTEIPTIDRDSLLRRPWSFVPDDHPLDEMVVFTTTGTSTGQVAYIASTPVVAASYAVMIDAALATRGLALAGGAGQTAVALVCWQRFTFTYASVSSYLGQGAILKLNLSPTEWNDPADVGRYLADLQPQVITGDPIAFAHLADLDVHLRPVALVSTAMALTDGLRARLEARFGCPAIDVYGLNEAGPVAAALPDGSGHVVIQPDLYVEVLGPDGTPCAPGERGEVTLTGGFNPALPLLRYRTGDHAALGVAPDGRQLLVGLQGRAPVPFAAADGGAVNTIDVTVALQPFALARFHVHQRADRSLTVALQWSGPADNAAVAAAMQALFGAVLVEVSTLADEVERVPFSSDLDA